MPAHKYKDGVDYVPTNRHLLMGHHYTSIAGLALMVVSVYLMRKGKNSIYTLVPMVFIIFMTGWAAIVNLKVFIAKSDWLLSSISWAILLLEIWLIIEGFKVAIRHMNRKAAA